MQTMPNNSVDAIITDPPYELGFMGKSWDSTGVAYDIKVWQECLRVLKPGGHLLAFGGSRTYHRLACAIEDAGFQIRDQIMWVYGSGFPKSLNIGKAIDKAAGAPVKVGKAFKVAGEYGHRDLRDPEAQGLSRDEMRHSAVTAEAKQWEGWGTALKPAHEPIVMARKPLDGTVAQTVLTHGTGGINIDGCRVESPDNDGKVWIRGGKGVNARSGSKQAQDDPQLNGETTVVEPNAGGRFPANFIHDGSDEVLQLFPDTKSGSGNKNTGNRAGLYGNLGAGNGDGIGGDSGSAARFFYCAKASKTDRNEGLDDMPSTMRKTMSGGEWVDSDGTIKNRPLPTANTHPTVKPTDLMRYLCRLVTPPNGTILDPFTGSGSTGKAAVIEGFNFIGIEQSAEYVQIATARINHAKEHHEN